MTGWPPIDPDTYEDERVEADPDSRAAYERKFHEDCGSRWSDHDNSYFGSVLPFGCLPELELRRRHGDR